MWICKLRKELHWLQEEPIIDGRPWLVPLLPAWQGILHLKTLHSDANSKHDKWLLPLHNTAKPSSSANIVYYLGRNVRIHPDLLSSWGMTESIFPLRAVYRRLVMRASLKLFWAKQEVPNLWRRCDDNLKQRNLPAGGAADHALELHLLCGETSSWHQKFWVRCKSGRAIISTN